MSVTILKKKRYHWLADMINNNNYRVGAEVGTATGNTASYLIEHCPGLRQLIVVDDWRPVIGGGQWESNNMKQVFMSKIGHHQKIKVLEGLSWEMASLVSDNSLDFVFIDASHDYESVSKDLKAWMPKVRPNGMVSGHDLHFAGVKQALTELLPDYNETGIDNCWFI